MKTIRHRFLINLSTILLWCYLKLIQITSKITIIGEQHAEKLQAQDIGHTFIFWHSRQLLLPLLRSNDVIHCLISNSRDGDYMTNLIKHFGKHAVRGSSSRNGLLAAKQLMKLLRDGEAIGIATDGPRGPAFEVKLGAIQMAQATQTPIIPVSYSASNKKTLSSWDGTFIPYPFTTISVVYGEAILIGRNDDVESARLLVQQAILQTDQLALSLVTKETAN